MTESFLGTVVQKVIAQNLDWAKLCFVLPNRRSQLFLQKEIACLVKGPLILPQVYSIEKFVVSISTKTPANELQQQQALYESYCKELENKMEQNNFEDFLGWSTPLLRDLNLVDQFLLERKGFFHYLSSLHQIREWGQSQDKIILNYKKFWQLLPQIYIGFIQRLEEKGHTTMGMCYRMAADFLETYLQQKADTNFIFCGFNALSPSESQIICEMLAQERAQVFWDIDKKALNDDIHLSSKFIREYSVIWPNYKEKLFKQSHGFFYQPKDIEIIEVQQKVGQAKEIAALIEKIGKKEDVSRTAIILADESLLIPLLYSIPKSIKQVNISMGYPLSQHPLTAFMFAALKMSFRQTSKGFYFKDVENILSLSEAKSIFEDNKSDFCDKVLTEARKEHRSYLDTNQILNISPKTSYQNIKRLFRTGGSPGQWIKDITDIIGQFYNLKEQDPIKLTYHEAAERITILLNQISELLQNIKQPTTYSLLNNLISQLITEEKLTFVGAPLKGLQILGVLETRAIDFDRVIMAGVNENIFPRTSDQVSWIPYDVRKQYGLPTQDEQDAIYTYHFYRLMYRAKSIKLIYNGATDGIQVGEPSRFIRQWSFDRPQSHKWSKRTQEIPFISPKKTLKSIPKTPTVISKLNKLASSGFSPSALNLFVKDGYEYYVRYILGLNEQEELEETFSYKTFGTIIHNCLERIYTPYIGKVLTEDNCNKMLDLTDLIANEEVKTIYPQELSGKNFLAFAAIKRNLKNWINNEMIQIKQGSKIEIIALETKISTVLELEGLGSPVIIKGTIDRVDRLNGKTRVLDYKTGRVQLSKLGIIDWELLSQAPELDQARQMLIYAFLWNKNNPDMQADLAGIIALRQNKKEPLYVGEKSTIRGKVNPEITPDYMSNIKRVLIKIINRLYNLNEPFVEPTV
jgi:hypothetical protein